MRLETAGLGDSHLSNISMSECSDVASDASTPRLEITDEQREESEQLKTKANAKFQENHFSEAIDLYTKAIELNPRNHILFANRAFCHIKLENYGLLIIMTSAIISHEFIFCLDDDRMRNY